MAIHADAARISVFVSIPPQRYFVQQIGKERVSVQVMVRPGASPATYEPKSVQMAAIAKADVYFSIGVPFEDVWLEKIAAANPEMQIVATDRGIEKRPMATHHHDHGRDLEGHGHGSDKGPGHHLDPHIWTAPLLVIPQVRTIATALKQIDPVHQKAYEANYATFAETLTQLDRELRETLVGFENRKFLVFHPSWGYFAQAYGLHQVPVEVEGKHPKPAHLHEIIEHARRDKIQVIFVQPQFSTKSARTLAAAIGAKVVVADPLVEDWADNLRKQTLKFKDALR
jgi:zinc transport system substrate-binding protein